MTSPHSCTGQHLQYLLGPIFSAVEDASNPSNFRPIALTPCIGKVFTTALRNWWLKFMLQNKYFDTSLPCSRLSTVVLTPVSSQRAGTPLAFLQKGVYQGDPLSVVIFNTVMNTLVDTITTRANLGYQFSDSLHQVNILQYADDTRLVTNSLAACQLLSKMGDWQDWTGMAAKVPKCQCISLEGCTGKLKDPQLHLKGAYIPSPKIWCISWA